MGTWVQVTAVAVTGDVTVYGITAQEFAGKLQQHLIECECGGLAVRINEQVLAPANEQCGRRLREIEDYASEVTCMTVSLLEEMECERQGVDVGSDDWDTHERVATALNKGFGIAVQFEL